VTQAVDQSAYGSAAWAWTSGDTSLPVLLNDPYGNPSLGLTQFGQVVEQYIATGAPPGGGGSGSPPAMTTGTGSDTLILNTEDAYQGNAQFTVSIDDKPIGGTFTAVGSHAAGQEQSYTFKGDPDYASCSASPRIGQTMNMR
jgi:hypothetical protein